MFLKAPNSVMENGIQKKSKVSPEKNSYTAETDNWKRLFRKNAFFTRSIRNYIGFLFLYITF